MKLSFSWGWALAAASLLAGGAVLYLGKTGNEPVVVKKAAQPAPFEIKRVSSGDETGTCHFDDRVEIMAGEREPLVFITDMEKGELAPIIVRQLPLGPDYGLLLGWSSWGGGMQTFHALLVFRSETRVGLKDRMTFTASRSDSGLIVLPDPTISGYRIGILKPSEPAHAAGDWEISFGKTKLDFKAIKALTYVPLGNIPADAVRYGPLFDVPGRPPEYAWFLVDKSGFR